MALESATTIAGLVATNPTAGDPVSQADDHLRLIKSVLQSEFLPQSVASNGYTRLPGGLILQWGVGTATNTADTTITFPTAFAVTPYAVVATGIHNVGNPASSGVNPECAIVSVSTFVARNTAGFDGFYWIAIGK